MEKKNILQTKIMFLLRDFLELKRFFGKLKTVFYGIPVKPPLGTFIFSGSV